MRLNAHVVDVMHSKRDGIKPQLSFFVRTNFHENCLIVAPNLH